MAKANETGKSFIRTNFSNKMIIPASLAIILCAILTKAQIPSRRCYTTLSFYIPGAKCTIGSLKTFVNSSEYKVFLQQSLVLRRIFSSIGVPFVTRFLSSSEVNSVDAYSIQVIQGESDC